MEGFPKKPNYKIIQILGQGSFGSVYKVRNEENNDIYVIKRILLKNNGGEGLKQIRNEAKILSSISSENIAKFLDSFEDNESFNIVMEYCDGLDLRKYINEHKNSKKFIKEDVIYHIILEICNGLKEIHKKNLYNS